MHLENEEFDLANEAEGKHSREEDPRPDMFGVETDEPCNSQTWEEGVKNAHCVTLSLDAIPVKMKIDDQNKINYTFERKDLSRIGFVSGAQINRISFDHTAEEVDFKDLFNELCLQPDFDTLIINYMLIILIILCFRLTQS